MSAFMMWTAGEIEPGMPVQEGHLVNHQIYQFMKFAGIIAVYHKKPFTTALMHCIGTIARTIAIKSFKTILFKTIRTNVGLL